MPLNKILLRYFLPMVGVYFLLIGLTYSDAFLKPITKRIRATTENVLEKRFSKAFIMVEQELTAFTSPNEIWITYDNKEKVSQLKRQAKIQGQSTVEFTPNRFQLLSREFFLTPLFLLYTLILLSPGKWKHRVFNLLLGTLIFGVFLTIKLFLTVKYNLINDEITPYFMPGQDLEGLRKWLAFFTPGLSITIAIFVWLLVAYRQTDWKKWLDQMG